MGFFDNIKKNLNIGGPKVRDFVAPVTCRLSDDGAPVSFTLVGGGSDAHVNGVRIELLRQRRGSNNSVEKKPVRDARFDNGGAGWDVVAGAEVPFEFVLPLNAATQIRNADVAGEFQRQRPDLSDEQAEMAQRLMSGLGGFLQRAGEMDALVHPDDVWSFKVVVDVAGVAVDPAAELRTDVLNPGEVGGGFRFSRQV